MLVNILPLTSDLIFAASLGLLLQLFTLLPAGYKLMHHYEMLLIKIAGSITKGGEVIRMKRRFLFALVANLAIFVALLGVRPTSWLAWYQPEAPRELLK